MISSLPIFGARLITSASACAGSSAGMMPSSAGQQLEGLQRLVVRDRHIFDAAAYRAARNAPGRCRDSRGRPRSNGLRGSGRRRSAAGRCGCRAARRASRRSSRRNARRPRALARRPRRRRSLTERSSRKGWNRPMAFEPPPTAATTTSGSRPSAASICSLRLVADHRLEVAHHLRIGVRPGGGADQVVGVLDIGHPVAQRLVHGVLQRAVAGRHRPHLGAEQLHAEDVGRLPLDVGRAHIDDAGQAEARRRRWPWRRRAGRRRSRR